MRVASLLLPFTVLLSFAPSEKDWFSYLGKTFEDKDVMAEFGGYGEYTSYVYRSDFETQMNWAVKGIAITTNDQSEIQKIYFYNEGYKLDETTFSKCNASLPFEVNLDMKPEEIKKKLGKPTSDEGTYFRNISYRTNFEYRFLFKNGVMQYMQIGLLAK